MKFALFIGLLWSLSADAGVTAFPSSIFFGTAEEGSYTRSRTVTVQYTGSEPGRVRVSHSCFGDISSSDNCFFEMDPNRTCSITFRFRPRRVGSVRCSVSVSSDKGGYQTVYANGRVEEKR